MKIGEKFRKVRKNLKLTQEVVAKRLEIGPDVLSRLENSRRFPDMYLIQKFCQLFNISANWLLFDEMPVTRTAKEDRTVEELLLELTTVINKQEELKPPAPSVGDISLDLDTLGNDPNDLIPAFEYMLKDKKVCRGMLQFFYMFLKPEADRRLSAAQNTPTEAV